MVLAVGAVSQGTPAAVPGQAAVSPSPGPGHGGRPGPGRAGCQLVSSASHPRQASIIAELYCAFKLKDTIRLC